MTDNNQVPNITIQAVKPVGYITSLVQTAGRILVSGLVFGLVLSVAGLTYNRVYDDGGLQRLLTGDTPVNGTSSFDHVAGNIDSENKLLVLDLSGLILGTPPYPVQDSYFYALYDVTFGYQLRDQIIAAAADEDIKGILLHTRTPGGTIFGSKAIHEGIMTYRAATGKPVAVWIEGMSASGGVYSTAGVDAIYAAPGSAIGSIGVIGGARIFYNKPTAFQSGLFASGVVTEEGIEVSYMHAGRGKDAGNPFRRMSDEEMAIRQRDLDQSYAEFVNHVALGRGMDPDKIVNELGAHIYGNAQAERNGLIDATLSQDEAYKALGKLASLDEDDFSVIRRSAPRQSLLDGVLAEENAQGAFFSQLAAQIEDQKCLSANQMSLVFHGAMTRLCNSE